MSFDLNQILCPAAREIRTKSIDRWGADRAVELVGISSRLVDCLEKLRKFARFNQSILITGESGVGKEFFAKACYLLSNRTNGLFVTVNCPQFSEGNTIVSELFGHVRGSFTGAMGDHKGLFETADGGVIFLDEVGDLHQNAQTMLLRALAENEVKPLGSSRTYSVNVRVVAATNRPLREMIANGAFREDLYFRLRYFPLDLPPLRERGEDWRLLIDYYLAKLEAEYSLNRKFSRAAFRFLEKYPWPGNVRELRSMVTIGYSMANGHEIQPDDFSHQLQQLDWSSPTERTSLLERMMESGECFWQVVQEPFLDRELNRSQVREIIAEGLGKTQGSYRKMGTLFNVSEDQYQKFMDFLRHHRLKPEN